MQALTLRNDEAELGVAEAADAEAAGVAGVGGADGLAGLGAAAELESSS